MLQQLNLLLSRTTLTLTQQQKEQLLAFVNLIAKWNKAYNLTAVRDPNEMLIRHIMDSIIIAPYLQGTTFIDVGTGPGLPGIPLAIVNPQRHFVLLDSLGKRVRFLKQVKHEIGLINVEPVQSRVEQFDYVKPFDGIISRAFASIKDMLTWCSHLSQSDLCRYYSLKGVYPKQELAELPDSFTIDKMYKLDVPDLKAERHLIIIQSN